MLNLLESNKNYKNLKKEIIELFPSLSQYAINSIYTETLRGQIKKNNHSPKVEETSFKWKKLYYENPKLKNKYKRYIIKLPNLLESVCPFELSNNNIQRSTDDIEKALVLIGRDNCYYFDRIHALTLLVLWEEVGRYRTIEKNFLKEEIKKYANIEQFSLDSILNDLTSCGFVVKLGDQYGVRMLIKL